MTEKGHRYTQYGFNGSYWEKKAARERPSTRVTWVGENGLTWIFKEEDNDD